MLKTVDAPKRLDVFLAENYPQHSRAVLQEMIKKGRVKVDGRICRKPAHMLKIGQEVDCKSEVVEKQGTEEVIRPANLSLPVLYESDDCLVINKPAGIAVHPGHGMDEGEHTILHGIAHLFEERSLPFSSQSVLVHRLDRDTTGCLLIAKNPSAHAQLQKQFETRTVGKQYLAIVAGAPLPKEATIDAPVGRNLTQRTKMSVLRTSVSREAKTSYRTLAVGNGCSLLLCDLHTGRTHQIRVHLSSIGHPIVGDSTYASSVSSKLSSDFLISGMCLHSYHLTFHDVSGQSVSVQAPPSDNFREALQMLGLHDSAAGL